MAAKKFQRKIEDFDCGHCGEHVHGNGYTNHCPHCLWSMHVDVNPGDRAAVCGGMMRPIRVEFEKGEYVLVHHCERCSALRRNRVVPEDDFDEVIKVKEQENKRRTGA